MHLPPQQKNALPNTLEKGRSLHSTRKSREAKQANSLCRSARNGNRRFSIQYQHSNWQVISLITNENSTPKNQKWQIIKLVARVQSIAKYGSSPAALPRGVFLCVWSDIRKRITQRHANFLSKNQKSQKQNSRKAKDIATGCLKIPSRYSSCSGRLSCSLHMDL